MWRFRPSAIRYSQLKKYPMENYHEADLTRGMEHMRPYVSIPSTTSPPPQSNLNTSLTSEEPPVQKTDQTLPETTYGVPSSLINPPRHLPQRTDNSNTTNPQKRNEPFKFGSRYLEEGDDIFEFNAWDHVEVDAGFLQFAEEQYARQREAPVSDFDRAKFTNEPEKWWNKFYAERKATFFKDRKWLFQEFPVLEDATKENRGECRVLECGAGAGNTIFPILKENKNKELMMYACDYSKKAVEVIRSNEAYDEKHVRAEVWDLASNSPDSADDVNLPPGVERGSIDIVIMVFVLSALAPTQWAQAMRNIYTALKPGGTVLLRDYGRGDLAQVRFKKGRWMGENFYVRGDGTRVYFFDKEEIRTLFSGQLPQLEGTTLAEGEVGQLPKFKICNLEADRRMLVNRQRKLKMYRCWMQGHFEKPELTTTDASS